MKAPARCLCQMCAAGGGAVSFVTHRRVNGRDFALRRQPTNYQQTRMLDSFKKDVQFSKTADAAGNLTIGRGVIGGAAVLVALIENRIASGAIGVVECEKLTSLFKVASAQKMPLALYIDSAGARVSEGLPALGAFRRMYCGAVKASMAGAPMLAVLGTNCFGGASMLAALCGVRYYGPHTRLAMSGPSILAAAAGASAIDDAFRAIAEVSIGTGGRTKLDALHDLNYSSPRIPEMQAVALRHSNLVTRLNEAGRKISAGGVQVESVQRKDLTLLYPQGYELVQQDGMASGSATVDASSIRLLGTFDKRPMTAVRAAMLTEQVLAMLQSPPSRLDILMDCETHSAALEDEKLMLSSYLATLAQALAALRHAGTHVQTIVLGKLGGGIYVALAAGSTEVNLVHGGEIQLLPGKAIAAILGDNAPTNASIDDYKSSGVADGELRIGLMA